MKSAAFAVIGGTGALGAALARRLAASGREVWIGSRDPEKARAFAALPMPTRALRPWRYVDLAGLDLGAVAPAAVSVTVEGALPSGVYVGSLAAGLSQVAAEARLGSLLPATEGRFLAANAAQWSEGLLVHVPRGAAVEQPVQVTIDASTAAGGVVYPRVLVIAGQHRVVPLLAHDP